MISAFYTGSSGVQTQQKSIDVSANNIANVNTTAYKAERMNFTDLLNTNLNGEQSPVVAVGHGVRPEETVTNFTQGNLENTGRPLDLAIVGKGFFAVKDANGQISYTRAGNFSTFSQNGENFLVDAAGNYLLGQSGGKVSFYGQPEDLSITGAADQETSGNTVQVGLFAFNNPDALEAVGESHYLTNTLAGPARQARQATLRQGYLEGASVDVAEEMTRLLQAQRAFQFSAKTVQAADEIEQITNNLRG